MDVVAEHSHSFPGGRWPFSEPENCAAFTSRPILDGDSSILLVFHDHDSEWQFLHGPVSEADQPHIICLGCALERDSSLFQLADLPAGWKASRASAEHSWQREPYDDYEDE